MDIKNRSSEIRENCDKRQMSYKITSMTASDSAIQDQRRELPTYAFWCTLDILLPCIILALHAFCNTEGMRHYSTTCSLAALNALFCFTTASALFTSFEVQLHCLHYFSFSHYGAHFILRVSNPSTNAEHV